jgi:hypothetical protein
MIINIRQRYRSALRTSPYLGGSAYGSPASFLRTSAVTLGAPPAVAFVGSRPRLGIRNSTYFGICSDFCFISCSTSATDPPSAALLSKARVTRSLTEVKAADAEAAASPAVLTSSTNSMSSMYCWSNSSRVDPTTCSPLPTIASRRSSSVIESRSLSAFMSLLVFCWSR